MISRHGPRRRARLGWFLGLTLLGCGLPCFGQGRPVGRLPGGVMPNQPTEPATVKLRVEGQEIVGQIRNAPLQQVLEELAAWSGIVFEIEAQENPSVSITFYRVPLSEAIQRLIGNYNSVIYYESEESGQEHIRLVRILSRNPRPAPPSLHYLGTGAITKRSDDVVDSPEQALAVLSGSKNLAARQKAIDVLVATKGAPAVEALKTVLSDPAVEIRVAAIEGLVTLGAHEALPQILSALKDEHPGVRQSAVIAVGLLGDSRNVKDLKPLLKDVDKVIAAAAEVAIQKLSSRRP
jgi:hypothetical protein